MKNIIRILVSGIALCGCAAKSLVPVGTVDYGLLVRGLRCEVEQVIIYDRDDPNSAKFFFDPKNNNLARENDEGRPRFASIAVQIDGNFDRNAGFTASVADFAFGRHGALAASVGASASRKDIGTVIAGDDLTAGTLNCSEEEKTKFNFRRLGLLEWYKNLSANVRTDGASDYLDQLKFSRTGIVKFGPNGASVAFTGPGSISPGAGMTITRTAQVDIVFIDPSPKATIRLDQQTIAALAKAIGPSGVEAGAARPNKITPAPADLPSPAEVLRNGQIERIDKNLEDLDFLVVPSSPF